MALELKQNLKLSQQLLITPQLQQAIKLLQLSRFELEAYIEQQLEENPILEIHEGPGEVFDEPSLERESFGEGAEVSSDQVLHELHENAEAVASSRDEEEVNFREEGFTALTGGYSQSEEGNEEAGDLESYTQYQPSLVDFLLDQVREIAFSPGEVELALIIIGNLSASGFLDLEVESYCAEQQLDLELFLGVLDTIQRFDPPGIAARDLGECLRRQLQRKKIKSALVELLLSSENLSKLGQGSPAALARELEVEVSDLGQALAIIRSLEPRPARQFIAEPVHTVIPDVKVVKLSGQWRVVINGEGLPNLRVSHIYDHIAKLGQQASDKAYWQDKYKGAEWLIKSIQQRQRTIFRVAECIVAKQSDFFEFGPQGLKPMILKDVANEIGMHESTVSRVTTNKYMATARGTFELKYFFNSAISGTDGEAHASAAVKNIIKEILNKEDDSHPYSDEKICQLLASRGIKIARRTVVKYREQLGVLSSLKRKKFREAL